MRIFICEARVAPAPAALTTILSVPVGNTGVDCELAKAQGAKEVLFLGFAYNTVASREGGGGFHGEGDDGAVEGNNTGADAEGFV